MFETWLEKSLLPQLKAGDIIVIDRAMFHKGQSIQKIVQDAGCEIWYLPSYSPDLNKRCALVVGFRNLDETENL